MVATVCAFLAALAAGSLVEYWGHRLMHAGLMRETHLEHHRDGTGQGWWPELLGYLRGSVLMLPAGFVHSVQAGVGFAVGSVVYAAFAAYAHQLQHDRPQHCFWLRYPVHFAHHSEQMWEHNFGITSPLWDWVFGTLRAVDEQAQWRRSARGAPHPEGVSCDGRSLVCNPEERH